MYAPIGVTEGVNCLFGLTPAFAVFGVRVWPFSEPYKNQKNTRPISLVFTTTYVHSCHDSTEHYTPSHHLPLLFIPYHTSPRTAKI